jgi:alpha-D-ribose 1-methylphosphonate 5-phosphate C-P lyase
MPSHPTPNVYPLEFDDVPFRVENQRGWVCVRTGIQNKFMNEIPQADGSSTFEVSDTGYVCQVDPA